MLWIDITNAPHVQLFRRFIKKRSDEVIVTARSFHNLEAMLQREGIEYTLVGSHGGESKKSKLVESANRVSKLAELISQKGVEAAIAKHSVELPRVAYGLGIPVIQVVDNEHAENQNRLFLSLCSKIIIPDALDKDKLLAQGASPEKIRTFNGLCEYEHVKNFEPDEAALGDLEPEGYVVIRSSAQYAAYFNSDDKTQEVIDGLAKIGCKVAVMPRGDETYKNAVNIRNGDSLSLIYFAKAMVGGGGTMNRESAFLGTPTISYYPQELLGVDKFLILEELMFHCSTVEEVITAVERVEGQKEIFRERARALRASMRSPIEVIEEEITSLLGPSS